LKENGLNTKLDDTDKKLVGLLQGDFPLSAEPFSALGEQLGINGEQVIDRIEKLKRDGIVRLIGPVFDARKLGYQTTLVVMKVAESGLDRAAEVLGEHPGVSHAYQRNHNLNLWFTLVLPPDVDMYGELQRLKGLINAEAVVDLPALRMFKIGAYFDVQDDSHSLSGIGIDYGRRLAGGSRLSAADRELINTLGRDISLVRRPFDAVSARLGVDVEQLLDRLGSLKKRGVMRRFGAAINHYGVGYMANAMACWIAAPDRVAAAGKKLSAFQEVSHCYERKTNPLWPYNLFAVIHGHTKDVCEKIAGEVSSEVGLKDYLLLFSTRELKKTRVNYKV